MDREQLLRYFTEHYLPRREVLMRLPLNVSIDALWPELVDRRRARAMVLPLYNADGIPYWYNLTDRMVRASEIISEALLQQTEENDPHYLEMTQAMTEEMYYTSLIEGAQIPIGDGIAFLQSSTEPENIYEQMLANNRQAWATMVQGLFHPIDETFVRTLTAMLTQDMDGFSDNYRSSDEHRIFAMIGEDYRVPAADMLVKSMEDLYAYLRRTDVHPLLKAAAGQAYILAIRPFDEGNERIARMISYAVLLRAGYTFYADVSISLIIACESYKYFKNMREIIRPENGNDLTYFMEYYLDVLAKALEKYRQDRDPSKDSIFNAERAMARRPIMPVRPVREERRRQDVARQQEEAKQQNNAPIISAERDAPEEPRSEDVRTAILKTEIRKSVSFQEETTMTLLNSSDNISMFEELKEEAQKGSPVSIDEQIRKLELSGNPRDRQLAELLHDAIATGFTQFSSNELSRHYSITSSEADRFCRTMFKYSIADRSKSYKGYQYRLNIGGEKADVQPDAAEAIPLPAPESADTLMTDPAQIPDKESPPELLRRLELSVGEENSTIVAHAGTALENGFFRFSATSWAKYFSVSRYVAKDELKLMYSAGTVKRKHLGNNFIYYFPLGDELEADNSPVDDTAREQFWDTVSRMQYSRSEKIVHLGEWVRTMIADGNYEFSMDDLRRVTGADKAHVQRYRDRLNELRLIRNVSNDSREVRYRFIIADMADASGGDMMIMLDSMTAQSATARDRRIGQFLKERLSRGETEFSTADWQQVFKMNAPTCQEDIRKALNLGLVRKNGYCQEDGKYGYLINSRVKIGPRCNDLTPLQRKYIMALYSSFGTADFKISDCADVVMSNPSSVSYHIENFIQREIVTSHSLGQNVYVYNLQVSPESHPECFVETDDAGQKKDQPATELVSVAG